jgi:small subunit ribosomal protein S8
MAYTTDPIADLLARIRNAQLANHAHVVLPASNVKLAIAKLLSTYGYVKAVDVIEEKPQNKIRIELAYDDKQLPMIKEIKRVSKPSRRVYVGAQEIPRVLNGLGVAILSTSKGVLSDREARAAHVGGELLCTVY